MRYDINNKGMYLAYCMHCGHEVGITSRFELANPNLSKVADCTGGINNLMLLDEIMNCCKDPSYSYMLDPLDMNSENE